VKTVQQQQTAQPNSTPAESHNSLRRQANHHQAIFALGCESERYNNEIMRTLHARLFIIQFANLISNSFLLLLNGQSPSATEHLCGSQKKSQHSLSISTTGVAKMHTQLKKAGHSRCGRY
jgi:hypothetical protein